MGNKNKSACIKFNKDQFTHARPLRQTLNTLDVYQTNFLQVLLFMHNIKTNSSPRIFLHQFQTINHTYANRNVKSRKRHLDSTNNWAFSKHRQRMKQHLKTKVLEEKALRLPASSCLQQILYLYVIPPSKRR